MKTSDARLLLYSIITSIENDLRRNLIKNLSPLTLNIFSNNEIVELAIKKYNKDNNYTEAKNNIEKLIEYIDFIETYRTILANKDKIENDIYNEFKSISTKIDTLYTIRNRIMHSRPLMDGDLSFTISFANELSKLKKSSWETCIGTLYELEKNPSYISTLSLPIFDNLQSGTFHNLPISDFDETGFIGREKDVEQVKKLILSANRVITILGEGGVGKTALLLKIAYDIVDMGDNCPFDIIIWVTAKTTILTPSGINEISNAIKDFSGIIEEVASAVDSNKKNIDKNIEEIYEYLKTFKVLLIIDNLESVLNEQLLDFIKESQQYCKIAITSRIGLGELEYRYTLNGLKEDESIRLLIESCKIRNIDIFSIMKIDKIKKVIEKINYSPLAIKWFVASLSAGKSPDDIISNKHDLLEYCFSNVYDKLTSEAKIIINIILASRSQINEAEIAYYTDLESVKLRSGLNNLLSTSFIKRIYTKANDCDEFNYMIPDLIRDYLILHHSPDKEFLQNFIQKKKSLTYRVEEGRRLENVNEFFIGAVIVRNSSEKIASKYLQEALVKSRKSDYVEALKLANQARELCPSYFEVYRISAFFKAELDDILGAEDDYKKALEIEPENPRLLYFYSGFLLRYLDDSREATRVAELSLNLRPDSVDIAMHLARCTAFDGNPVKAIEIYDTILKSNNSLSVKQRKICSDCIIDFCRRTLDVKFSIEKDFESGLKFVKKGIAEFLLCARNGNSDNSIINKLGHLIYDYIELSQRFGLNENNNIKMCIENLKEYLIKTTHWYGIVRLLSLLNIEINIASSNIIERHIGIVAKVLDGKNYTFLENEEYGRLYLHKSQLRNKPDWNNLKLGKKASFYIGTSDKSPCAFDVVFIE